jgi:hypothetical protein
MRADETGAGTFRFGCPMNCAQLRDAKSLWQSSHDELKRSAGVDQAACEQHWPVMMKKSRTRDGYG